MLLHTGAEWLSGSTLHSRPPKRPERSQVGWPTAARGRWTGSGRSCSDLRAPLWGAPPAPSQACGPWVLRRVIANDSCLPRPA